MVSAGAETGQQAVHVTAKEKETDTAELVGGGGAARVCRPVCTSGRRCGSHRLRPQGVLLPVGCRGAVKTKQAMGQGRDFTGIKMDSRSGTPTCQ